MRDVIPNAPVEFPVVLCLDSSGHIARNETAQALRWLGLGASDDDIEEPVVLAGSG